ncbi:hypothetical protein [Burkholderia ubonensis]|uniref:hypothetical protein n=1 Tax=Burkholderia ubonensis TaxID=101571 RepID=UPI0012F719B5|nr:hypothetical protein [Burkholderia ubonensis]
MDGISFAATWGIGFDEDAWSHMQHVGRFTDEDKDMIVVGPVLDSTPPRRVAMLVCYLSDENGDESNGGELKDGDSDVPDDSSTPAADAGSETDADITAPEGKQIIFRLRVADAPDHEPPESVLDANSRAGGADGLITSIAKSGGGSPQVATLSCQAIVDANSFACPSLDGLKSKVFENIKTLGTPLPENIGLKFENGVLGLEKLSITRDDNAYTLNFETKVVLTLDNSLHLTAHDQLQDLLLDTLFVKRDES